MSGWKSILERLYKSGKIDVSVLEKCLNSNLITEEEYLIIIKANVI